MAKLTINRVFEVSKSLVTDAGKELKEFIEYTADIAEQTIRALRSGLTFQDNLNCEIKTVTGLKHNVEQTVLLAVNRQPWGVLLGKVISSNTALCGSTGFIWHLNQDSQLVIKLSIPTAPATATVDAVIILLYQ